MPSKNAPFALEKIGLNEIALKRRNGMKEFCLYQERRDKKQISVQHDPTYWDEIFRLHFLTDLEAELKHQSGSQQLGQRKEEIPLVAWRNRFFGRHHCLRTDFLALCMLVSVPGRASTETVPGDCKRLVPPVQHGPQRTYMFFPLGNNRIAFGITFNHARKRVWTDQGVAESITWTEIDAVTKKKIATKLDGQNRVFDGLFTNFIELIPDWDSKRIYAWPMRDTAGLQIPYAKEGNVILIGDAAHAMLPCIGQGANRRRRAPRGIFGQFAKSDWKRVTLKDDLTIDTSTPSLFLCRISSGQRI
ncbi:hypothetical protein BJ742DRAFT_860013 [Cladochytrium replicatum]|nr:hypothetical protein BJ742DRAFT_860013 [Cladochytrium replicatum]